MKRYLAVFLCLCLIGIGGFTVSAKADTVIVYVGGTTLSEDGDSVTGGSGTATLTYEDGNPVLTLNNYTYSGAGIYDAAICYYDDAPLTIRLAGTSSVTHVPGNTNYSYGFNSGGYAVVTIEGDGSLKLYGGSNQWNSHGMRVNGPLTISGGQVEAVGGGLNLTNSNGNSYGIRCDNSLSILGGTVIATGGDVTVTGTGYRAYSYGIEADGNIEITGGALEASGGVVTDSYSSNSSWGVSGSGDRLNIGSGIEYVRAKGYQYAIDMEVRYAVSGTGWNNYEGTGNGTALAASDNYKSVFYKHLYFGGPVISATVTFKVENGKWNDGSETDKSATVTGRQGDTLKLKAGDIPAVGGKPAEHFKAGSWDTTPNTTDAVTDGDVFTYTYAEQAQETRKVTFKVENGEWDNGGSADIVKTYSKYENEDLALKLAAGDIPAVGSKPAQYYKAGSWDVAPDTETVLSQDKTYTYSYEKIPVTLSVKDTQGTEHEKLSGEDAVITVKGIPDDRDTYRSFEKASVDGTELRIGTDAEKAEGSLVLTIKSKYLDTLSEGNHTVTLKFSGGTVETPLKVKAAAPTPTTKPTPKTGDSADLLLWCGLMILGILGMAAVMTGRRRKE